MNWVNIKKTLGGHYSLESLHNGLRIGKEKWKARTEGRKRRKD